MNPHRSFPAPALSAALVVLALALALALAAGANPARAQGLAEGGTQVIVVSATRHAMPLADAPASISVVPRQTLEQLGADNLLEALRGETGVTAFGRTIGGRRTISLRGMESRHTLYLVDGRRIGASDGVIGHTDFQLGWVAVEEIERIEVLRGPLSALYGAEALGGVLQIVTRAPSSTLEGSASAEGSWADGGRGGGGHRVAARISGPLGSPGPGLRIALVLADSRREAVSSVADARLHEIEGRHKHDGAVRLAWDNAPGQRIELDLRQGQEERWGVAIERSGQRRLYLSDTDVARGHGALTWHADWGGAGEWRSKLSGYGSHLAMQNARTNGVAALRPNTLSDDVLEGEVSGRPAAEHLLTLGFEGRRERLGNQALPGQRAEADHRSVHAHDEWQVQPGLAVTAGLRHDEHERFGGLWSPRLYAVWRVAPQWVVKGGASRGFKPPTLKQITPGYSEDEGPFTYFSDPLLKAETNRATEVGIGWDTPAAGWQAMLFDNHVRNLIVPLFIGTVAGRGQYVFANLEQARLRGVETAGTLRAAPGLTLGASVQYLDAQDGAGQRLEKRPRIAAGLTVAWNDGPWHALGRVDHVQGQLLATSVAGQAPQPVPSLTVVGGSMGRRLGPALDIELGVANLTDMKLSDKSPLFTWAEAPRTWRLTLRGRW